MKTKQSFLLSILASLILSLAQPVAAQHHRSQQYRTQVAAQQSDNDDDIAIDAFSDTTSIDTTAYDYTSANDDEWHDKLDKAIQNCVDEINEDSSWFGIFKFAMKGMLLIISVVLIGGLIISIPYFLIAWLIAKFLYHKRTNIMQGINNIENEFSNISSSSPSSSAQPNNSTDTGLEQHNNRAKYEYYWERGVKKFALGVGLLLAGWIWYINLIMGIGALLACYGLSQIYLASRYK